MVPVAIAATTNLINPGRQLVTAEHYQDLRVIALEDAEYIKSNIDSPVWQNPDPSGYHVTASWILTGEMRAYNKRVGVFGRIPVSRDVNNDGCSAWEISARYSYLDGNQGLLDAGELDIWSAGVNWWLTPLLNVNLNYRFVTLERFGIVGESHGLNSRISMLLE